MVLVVGVGKSGLALDTNHSSAAYRSDRRWRHRPDHGTRCATSRFASAHLLQRPPARSGLDSSHWLVDARLQHLHRRECNARVRQALGVDGAHIIQNLPKPAGVADNPMERCDGYVLSDVPFDQPNNIEDDEPDYPDLNARLADMRPKSIALMPEQHPFRVAHVRRFTQMTFNISSYQRLLMDDFLRAGGEIVHREFAHPRQFGDLRESTIVNCTGYGARLVPRAEVDYALVYRGHSLVMVPRRDGLLVAAQGAHDFGNDDTAVDRALSQAAVERLATVFD